MKTVILLFVLFVFSVVKADSCTYLGRPVSEQRFKKLYRYFKQYLYTDRAGKVYVLQTPRPAKIGRDSDPGAIGRINANITAVRDSSMELKVKEEYEEEEKKEFNYYNTIKRKNAGLPPYEIIKVQKTRYFPGLLLGVSEPGAVGAFFTGTVVVAGTGRDDRGRTIKHCYTMVSPISEAAFKTYLASGVKLHYFKRKYTRAKYKDCPKCKGMGVVPRKPRSLSTKPCPECSGKRRLQIAAAKTEYLKLPLKR